MTAAPVLRPAAPGDAHALAAIIADWRREVGWMPVLHTPDEDRGYVALLIEGVEVTVAEGGGRPIGFLARDDGEVPALFVAREARRRGIGRALMGHAKSRAWRLGLWTFQANAPARAFYAREGLRETRRTSGLNEEGLPDLRLEWEAP